MWRHNLTFFFILGRLTHAHVHGIGGGVLQALAVQQVLMLIIHSFHSLMAGNSLKLNSYFLLYITIGMNQLILFVGLKPNDCKTE